MDELVRLNGCKGVYDGYGGAGNHEWVEDDPAAWHQKCYAEATDAEKLDETPSEYARNQGFGFPRADCMSKGSAYVEPPRVKYAEVSKDDILEYLAGLCDEDKDLRLTPTDITDEDFESMRARYGDRFAHDHTDGDGRDRGGKYWGDYDPGDHYFDMRDRFQGRHNIVSEVAYEVLRFAKKRLG